MAEAIEHQADAHGHHLSPEEEALSIENQKLATWLYLSSEVIIFSVMIAAYVVFRINNPEVVREAHGEINILLVSLNTFLLLASSWMVVMGLAAIEEGNRDGLVKWMSGVSIVGTIFIALQIVEYQELAHHGISIYNSTFGMRFFAPTAFHGAHVIVGVLWAVLVTRRAYKGHYDKNPVGVEIFGLYWHFVDVVWIVLFGLLYLV